MKIKIKNTDDSKYAIPTNSLTIEELKVLLKKSEKGPFYPVQELKKKSHNGKINPIKKRDENFLQLA